MTQQKLTITVDEDGATHSLSGIPTEAWDRFKAEASLQFPKHGDDAWAAFLSEVILSVSGGDATVTYFMTDVPRENAESLQKLMGQIGFSWDRFHAYLLRSAVLHGHLRLVNLINPEDPKEPSMGVFIATGLHPQLFTRLEATVGVSFEQFMGNFLLAAAAGTLEFSPDNKYVEPTEISA